MTPIRRFRNLLKVDKKDIYQIILYSIMAGIISLSLPLGIQSIVNFLQAGQVSTSWIVLVFIVVIGVALVGVLMIMQYRIVENLQQKIFVRSSFDFAYRFPKMKFNKLYSHLPAELANRFFDTTAVQKGIAKMLLEISGATLQILFGIILLSLYHSFFILFGIILLGLLYLIFKVNFNSGVHTSLKESDYKYKVAHWLQEIARNHLSFKNKQVAQFSLKKNDHLVNEYLAFRERHFSILKRQFSQLVGFKVLITAGLLIIGGIFVLTQQMNIGQFVAAEIIILTISNAVEKLFSGIEIFYDLLASIEKLGKITDIELEEEEGRYKLDQKDINIEVDSLSYQFPDSDNFAIKNVSMNIEQGDHILISGNNGSGKTTLIRLLSRVIEPTEGVMFLNDINYKKYSLLDYRDNISTISLGDNVFEGTLLENIICKHPKASKKEIIHILDKLQLSNFVKSLPNGLDTEVHSGGSHLSSSIVEKILIARCILSNPKIIFMEEPLKNTDEASVKSIIDFITEDNKEWTLIISSKISYWKSKCNKHFTMENGTLK